MRRSCAGIALSVQESSLSIIAAVDESIEPCDGPALASSWLGLADHLLAVLNTRFRGALVASLAVDLTDCPFVTTGEVGPTKH